MENFRRPAAVARLVVTAVAGLALDLWAKAFSFDQLGVLVRGGVIVESHPPYPFIPGWLHFSATINKGAVFGLGDGQLALFIAVSVAAVAFLLYLFANSGGRQRVYQIILGLLMAGVLGNMYDRLHFGYVRDMIHILPGWPRAFPWIFNVADALLCTGVGLMLIYSLVHDTTTKPAKAGEAQA